MKTSRRFLSVALLLSCITAGLGAPPASAALKSWTVKVIKVDDGDTFKADSDGDGDIDYVVRMIGINTPEGRFASKGVWNPDYGTCHSKAARDRLAKLILGKRVVLKASSFASTGAQNRKLRFVHLLDGRDVNAIMLRESWAVAYPNDIEPSRNKAYITLARAAKNAATPRRVWNPAACGEGPNQDMQLKVRLRWDANDNDETNLNQEYVRIENPNPIAFELNTSGAANGGWVLRDSSSEYYYFKPGVAIPANGSLTVHTGSGTDGAGSELHKRYYWNQTRSLFGNETTSRGQTLGDGAYLYDPRIDQNRGRDLRFFMEYPCLSNCADPIGQKLELTVNYDGPGNDDKFPKGEWVNIRNTDPLETVDISGYMVESHPWTYEIERDTTLAPGERLRIYGGKDTPTRLAQYWGNTTKSMFAMPEDGGDTVRIRSMEGKLAKRFRWPCATCDQTDVRIARVTAGSGVQEIVISNKGLASVNLADWMIFHTDARRYHFDSVVLPAGGTLTLHPKAAGIDTPTDLYWGTGEDEKLWSTNGAVTLYTAQRVKTNCIKYGTGTC